MSTKFFIVAAIAAILSGCQSEKSTLDRRTEPMREEAAKAGREGKEELEKAKIALSRRLDQLDEQVDKLEARAKTSSAKAKVRFNEQAQNMRVEAKKLRAKMSTWDDKAESAWRTTKREVEEGLDKTENAIKKFFDDIKD